MNAKKAVLTAMAMTAMGESLYRGHHAGEMLIREVFDFRKIMYARKRNQRGKNQRRMRGK